MLQGWLREDGQAVVELKAVCRDGSIRTVSTVIDTGFNGQASLSRRIVDELDLPLTYEGTVFVGTGLLTGKVLLINFATREVTVRAHIL